MKLVTNITDEVVATDIRLDVADRIEAGNELVIAYGAGPGDVRLLFPMDASDAAHVVDRLLAALNEVRTKLLARAARA